MNIDKIQNRLKKTLKEKRYIHSINVMQTAMELANIHGVDVKKAQIAGLVHDCAKGYMGVEAIDYCIANNYVPDEIEKIHTKLLHGKIGSWIANSEYGIKDAEILKAIKWHTTGAPNMGALEKIVYIADYIEPNRKFNRIDELRDLGKKNINLCLVECFNITIEYIIDKGFLLHPRTVETRNKLLIERKWDNGTDK